MSEADPVIPADMARGTPIIRLRGDSFFRQLFRSAPGPYLILKPDSPRFTIVEVNDAYLSATNTTRKHLIGRALFDVFPDNPDDEGATGERNLRASLETVLATLKPNAMPVQKYDIPRLDGEAGGFEERYWSALNTPVLNPEGQISHIIHYVEDVTHVAKLAQLRDMSEQTSNALRNRNEWLESEIQRRKQAELQAEESRIAAEKANQAKGAFLAHMSHELRTPLNAIGGYVQLLEMGIRGAITPEQRDYLHRIKRSGEHLLGLINQILDLAKIEAGNVAFELKPIQVCELLSAVEDMVAPQLIAKGIQYDFSSCDSKLQVVADIEKASQILINLLSNATRHTPAGGRISIRCTADTDGVAIDVADSGDGIALEDIGRIFEPFIQVGDSSTRKGGVGLGLPISKELAVGMGGQLSVVSQLGVGSIFTLRLVRHLPLSPTVI